MATRPMHEGKADRARALSNVRQEAVYDTIAVRPVTSVIGVDVDGVDMTKPISAAQVADLNHALANHNVLFFRDQPALEPTQQTAFARNFGDLHVHPAAPTHEDYRELFVIHTHGESFVNNGSDWHSDVSSDTEPPLGTISFFLLCMQYARDQRINIG